ncbi:AmpG family muropeptide MFS transporter [Roseococcus suduntuyensis]|uniref:PAT family beta-lactamase induction signal transducer AmpG n=1 Tax=Roseococcus suduntuyensis TaxID=455361 RepID=A0A840ABN4_9PROT|nr:MFS transporter [Roseococcus suduntuyensis]MBB3897700.1 PAT family beta-lactamase induction signal transducer AmpG [Roseococcus suduntuyensis]
MRALLRDRRFLVMLALGFSAGVPLPLTGFVLRQWFAESDIPLAAIGFTALIGLSYSLKFLWAPVLDHAPPPFFGHLGRRRGWLLSIQPPLMLAIVALGWTNPATAAAVTAAVAVVVAFLSASQDIVIDAYRIEILGEEEQGYGFACYVWGYRFAMLAANAGALGMVGLVGWDGAFLYCAALVLVGLIAALLAPEPEAPPRVKLAWGARLKLAVVDPFRDFMQRRYWLAILLFIALFKLGEALAGIMTAPFYRSLGFTRGEVAAVASVFGLMMTLLGVLAGGWFVSKIGVGRALIITGILQMVSNLMYVALNEVGRDMGMLYAQVGVENFTDGLADAAFVAYLTSLTNRAFSATQYALLSSLAAVPLRFLGGWSGQLAEGMGWTPFFLLTTVAALPALCIMLFLLKRLPPPPRAPTAAATG